MYNPSLTGLKRVLCMGCHADDIEIGCGGALLRLQQDCPGLEVGWVVLSAHGQRADEARASAARWLTGTGRCETILGDFNDRYLPAQWSEAKDFVHAVAARFDPDLVLTHRRDDAHQDHRVLGELAWNAFRDHMIWEYEIPKYDGDLGQPNVYVVLDEATCQKKVDMLKDGFPSQRSKPWFTADAFWAALRMRGLECNSPSGFAEGLYSRKTVL